MVNTIWEWIKAILVALIVVAILNVFLGTTTVVSSSMNPSLMEGDRLILTKKTQFKRGDIVTFESDIKITFEDLQRVDSFKRLFLKEGANKTLIKRIVGMPGDKIEIKDGVVYINDSIYNEKSYINQKTSGKVLIQKIPEGQYFLMGDNRGISLDSRSSEVGLVSEDKIKGVITLRFFPLNKVKLFRGL